MAQFGQHLARGPKSLKSPSNKLLRRSPKVGKIPLFVTLDNRLQLVQLEKFLTPQAAEATDVGAITKQLKWDGITPWDLPHLTIQQRVRELLGLQAFIDAKGEWEAYDLEELKNLALTMVPQIKRALNITVRENMAPAQILGQLLDQIGLRTQSRQFRQHGTRTRAYALNEEVKAHALAILKRRAERLTQQATDDVTPCVLPIDVSGGCDGEDMGEDLSDSKGVEGGNSDLAPESEAYTGQLGLFQEELRRFSSGYASP